MEPSRIVTRVSIKPTCIACDVCRTICPQVFVLTADGCRLRASASDPAFLAAHSEALVQAAAACPARAIRLEMADADVPIDSKVRDDQGFSIAAACPRPMGRRRFTVASLGWLALGASAAACMAGFRRFLQPAVKTQAAHRLAVGPLSVLAEQPPGTVLTRYKKEGVWLVRLEDRLVAMSIACPHLGCALNWHADVRKFKCPCHGSGFDIRGMNLEGPAPGPMIRFGLRVEDGVVYVDRSRTYRSQGGLSEEPGSYLRLT